MVTSEKVQTHPGTGMAATLNFGLWTLDSEAGGRFAAGYVGLDRSRVGSAGLCWGRRRLRRRNGQRAGNKLGR
jgi:hypothetical protein